jgi:hypothetical protein
LSSVRLIRIIPGLRYLVGIPGVVQMKWALGMNPGPVLMSKEAEIRVKVIELLLSVCPDITERKLVEAAHKLTAIIMKVSK